MAEDFGVEMRFIKGRRPMSNGQAEAAVKLVKNKMKMLALENSNFSFYQINRHIFFLQKYNYFKVKNFQENGMVLF